MNDIQMHQRELENKLWAMANNLRGTMEPEKANVLKCTIHNAQCIIDVFASQMNLNKWASPTPQFSILHFQFSIR